MFSRFRPWVIVITVIFVLTITAVSQAALGDRNLSRGARGADVTDLQKRLNMLGYVVGPIDGIFGRQTEAGVRLFQRERGLRVDGIAGPQTITLLKRMTGESVTAGGTPVGYKNSDIELLARLVSAEARGESFRGQVAVAAVVLNRVESSSFPNTIPDVIYEPRAFSPVADGQIRNHATSSALRATHEALNGIDPSYGAVFFFNPAKTNNAFIWSRPQIIQIGNHIFAR